MRFPSTTHFARGRCAGVHARRGESMRTEMGRRQLARQAVAHGEQTEGARLRTGVLRRGSLRPRTSRVGEGWRRGSESTEADPKSAINFSGFLGQSRLHGHYKTPHKQGTFSARSLKISLKVASGHRPGSGTGY